MGHTYLQQSCVKMVRPCRATTDPDIKGFRQQWLKGARRGEHWLLSYEAIRAATLAWTGDHEPARRNLADAAAMISRDRDDRCRRRPAGSVRMGVSAAGEVDRARPAGRHLRSCPISERALVARRPTSGRTGSPMRPRHHGSPRSSDGFRCSKRSRPSSAPNACSKANSTGST